MKVYGLILLTSISVLILLTSVSMLVLLNSVSMLVLLTGVFVGVLTLICSIMMLEYIAKISDDNGFNNLMGWSHVYI